MLLSSVYISIYTYAQSSRKFFVALSLSSISKWAKHTRAFCRSFPLPHINHSPRAHLATVLKWFIAIDIGCGNTNKRARNNPLYNIAYTNECNFRSKHRIYSYIRNIIYDWKLNFCIFIEEEENFDGIARPHLYSNIISSRLCCSNWELYIYGGAE